MKVRNLQEYLQKLPQVGEQSDGIVKAVNLHLNRIELYISFFKCFLDVTPGGPGQTLLPPCDMPCDLQIPQ